MSERENNRRKTDMDVVMHLSDNYYTINGALKEKNELTFQNWYKESKFYLQDIKLKNLNRLFNKRAIR